MRGAVVIDLNVFVRALLKSGSDRAIYEAIKNEKISIAFCPDMLENLAKVLLRPRLKLNPKDVEELLAALRAKTIMVKPTAKIEACRDASDNIILETAIESKAAAIITNDPDLLVLNPFRGIAILDSHQFIKTLQKISK